MRWSRSWWRHGSSAAAVVVLAAGLAAGCSGGSQTASEQTAGGSAAGGGVGAGAPEGPQVRPGSVNRVAVQTRAVIKTGSVAVVSENPERSRAEVDGLLSRLGGSIDREETSRDDQGNIENATLVLRVPVARFDEAVAALEGLGRVRSSESTAKDVTTQVIDVNERVETIRNSLDRLQTFLAQTENIDDLIRFESEITERESELRSLQAQQAYLADQTSMATITLYLSSPAAYVEPPETLEDAGFLAGLDSGWNALMIVLVAGVTVLGAVLPFVAALALVGVPAWFLVRAFARRRAQPAEETAPPEPPAA